MVRLFLFAMNSPLKNTTTPLTPQHKTPPRRPRLSSKDNSGGSNSQLLFGDASPRSRRRINSYGGTPLSYTTTAAAAVDTENDDVLLALQMIHPPQKIIAFYLLFVVVLHGTSMLVTLDRAWTLTNALHFGCTLAYLHFCKGAPNDTQGDVRAFTVWEQLQAQQQLASSSTSTTSTSLLALIQVLWIVPTALAYGACHARAYEPRACALNLTLWCVLMVAKLPCMNGIRLFGINKTPGIDDDVNDHDE
jgi:hypothetical protein